MGMTQMNTRIDEDIKRRGDSVFASLGLSPSEVVRAVWEFAVKHEDAPAIVASAMEQPSDGAASLEKDHRVFLAKTACNAIAEYRESRKARVPDSPEQVDYDALREDAWRERFAERGLV